MNGYYVDICDEDDEISDKNNGCWDIAECNHDGRRKDDYNIRDGVNNDLDNNTDCVYDDEEGDFDNRITWVKSSVLSFWIWEDRDSDVSNRINLNNKQKTIQIYSKEIHVTWYIVR